MGQITIAPKAWGYGGYNNYFSGWKTEGIESQRTTIHANGTYQPIAFLFEVPNTSTRGMTITANVQRNQTLSIRCTLNKDVGAGVTGQQLAVLQQSGSGASSPIAESFEFADLTNYGSSTFAVIFDIYSERSGNSAIIDTPRIVIDGPDLTVTATPTSLYANSNITLNFTNRLGQTLNVDFYAGSTKLNITSYQAASDTFTTSCPAEWVSGSSTSITARVTDSLGRTATSNAFTLNAISGGTTTAISPTGTLSGSNSITFEWSYIGPGTQQAALLEISYDQNNWETLWTTNGSTNTYTASSNRFRVGRLYWRVTVTNTYNLTSQASGSVTITYAALSVAATPQSVYTGSNITLAFTNRLGQTLTVEWYSNNIRLATPSSAGSDTAYGTPSDSWFNAAGVTGNSMSVQARVSDSLGRTATSNNVTVNKPQGMTASPISPRSTTMDGAEIIPFSWSASGDGTIVTSKLRWSHNGVDWTEFATVRNGETVYRAPAVNFPAGTIYWQVMVTNSFGMPGAWSSSAQFTVRYSATSQAVPVNSPTSGVISASIDETFQIALEASGPVYSPFQVQEATFYWRSNEMGSFTAVAMTPGGNTASVTIPADTFESGTLEWYASATDTTGRTTQTETFTLTALVADIEAAPLSPINTVEAGNAPIIFRWRYGSIDGSPQSRAELQYSADGNTWVTFGSSTGTGTSYTAPADTFPGRTIQWRVRAYNADNIAGPWSNPVSFVVVGATVITAVEGDGKPFLTVSWQTLDQLAYEVRIDGQIFGPYRDESARSLQVREPLADGIHDIAVRAQNQYGLWSAWKEAQTSIANVPGTAVVITAAAGSGAGTAGLAITGGEQTGDFLIYRDGSLIGRTAGRSYTDRTAAPGTHEYYVLQALAGGYYTKSNSVGLSTEVRCPMIALLSGGDFLALELSAEADRSQTITKGGEVVYVQYSGAKFPEAEIGEAESLTVTGDGSFTAEQEAEARRFETMLKKPVIYKTPGGEVVVGVLQGFTRRDPRFFKSYGFTVTQMEWRDYTNA